MNGWKRVVAIFSGLWGLFWLAWTLDVYVENDLLVFPFVELALFVPLGLAGVCALAAKAMNSMLQEKGGGEKNS